MLQAVSPLVLAALLVVQVVSPLVLAATAVAAVATPAAAAAADAAYLAIDPLASEVAQVSEALLVVLAVVKTRLSV